MNDNVINVDFRKNNDPEIKITVVEDGYFDYECTNEANINPDVADFVPETRAAWVYHLFNNLEPDDFYDFMAAVRSPEDFEKVDHVLRDMVFIYFGLPE